MGEGPFERHIREAIELNRRRAPLYADATAGVSLSLSRSLIRRERMLLPLARWLDRRDARYAAAGVPVLGELFVSMLDAPAFLPRVPVVPARTTPAPARALAAGLRRAWRRGGFVAAADALEQELDRLSGDPAYWCMRRHMLESARRLCHAEPRHVAAAHAAGLPSPAWMHRLLLRLHLAGLPAAARLDAKAYPLQARGIPILCRDLPSIPADFQVNSRTDFFHREEREVREVREDRNRE
ncbi:MAG TPA: hypothetical protein VFZ18_10210 [Longimicrobiaceae bacterium]